MLHREKSRNQFRQTIRTAQYELRSALRIILFILLLFFASYVFGQTAPCINVDSTGVGGSVMNPSRRPVPYPYLREADVMWSKRIWRTLDLREKMNQPYYYPETPHDGLQSLFDLIKCGVMSGAITAFDNPAMDDEFKVKMDPAAVENLLVSKEVISVENPNAPGTYEEDTVVNEISSTDILAYWIKEDWFFDKQRSVMDVRILGICPMATKTDPSSGAVLGYRPLFWLYFPQLRPLLVKQGVYLGQNYAQRITYDDMFQKRYFSSYIHKESNVYDRTINQYETGVDALLESDRIKNEISNFESDMWHY
ncbi:MAG TPA: gliding motility protein GldN [Bacteroidia bacterium]|jgi:gliding motility associated protien GldN|nr:gliding motility protein GldN [Bacteroidia bacterium]